MTFVKGQSGNPAGRRKGSRNKVTELAEGLAGAGVEEMTRRLMVQAGTGNGVAMRLYFDRIWPKRRGAPIAFDMPPIRSLADVPVALEAICQGVTDGELSVEEFETLSRGVHFMKRSLEAAETDARLARHEAMLQVVAKGLGGSFERAWRAGEPADGVRLAEAAAGVACATDMQADVAPATDLQADVAAATDRRAAPLASATDLQPVEEAHGRHAPATEAAAPLASAKDQQLGPLAPATDLQSGESAGSPEGAQRHPEAPPPDFAAARLRPGHDPGRAPATPLASATNLQGAAAESRMAPPPDDPPPDARADGKDDARMRELLGPEYGAPWQGYGETRGGACRKIRASVVRPPD